MVIWPIPEDPVGCFAGTLWAPVVEGGASRVPSESKSHGPRPKGSRSSSSELFSDSSVSVVLLLVFGISFGLPGTGGISHDCRNNCRLACLLLPPNGLTCSGLSFFLTFLGGDLVRSSNFLA